MTSTNELIAATVQNNEIATQQATPSDLIRFAMAQDDVDLDRLERLYDLQRRWESDNARRAYVSDMAAFKAGELKIVKDRHVKFNTASGVTEYDHASIGNVVGVICKGLGAHGFSHRWEIEQKDAKVTVRCIITHRLGHSEMTELFASPDSSGGKNPIQSIISTKTYLERHTLLAATGLATSDQEDDDGRGSSSADGEPTEEQRAVVQWIEAISKVITEEALKVQRQEMIDFYKGEGNIPTVLKKAVIAKKRTFLPPKDQSAQS